MELNFDTPRPVIFALVSQPDAGMEMMYRWLSELATMGFFCARSQSAILVAEELRLVSGTTSGKR